MEKQLHQAMMTARGTFDKVTGRNYAADSGAAVVMEAKTGRIVAMASQPTYDPKVWSGGITSKELKQLYSEGAGNPLLSRASQGQFAPGSTWKPIMTVGALNNGFSEGTQLDCSSGLQVGNRWFKNYESGRLRLHQLRQGPRALLRHLLLPRRPVASGRSTAATPPT